VIFAAFCSNSPVRQVNRESCTEDLKGHKGKRRIVGVVYSRVTGFD
jgi:hypothetical protein